MSRRSAGAACAFIVTAAVVAPFARASLFDPPTASTVSNAMSSNLSSVSAMTADVDCQSSSSSLTYTGGYMAAKGTDKFMLEMGTSGAKAWRNSSAFNMVRPTDLTQTIALRFDDTTQNAQSWWVRYVGFIDPREMYAFAAATSDFATVGTETVNGVSCVKLAGDRIRMWVDAANPHRIIRCELDYVSNPTFSGLAWRCDYSGWGAHGSSGAGEFPDTIDSSVWQNDEVYLSWSYTLSNIVLGATVSDSVFTLVVPSDTSVTAPIGSGGGVMP